MKYIMLQKTSGEGSESLTRDIPIIFPEALSHDLMAEAMQSNEELKGCVVVSAGFYETHSGECHGASTTLNLESRPADTMIIKTYSYTHGLLF